MRDTGRSAPDGGGPGPARMLSLVAAPDKFRGTASARQAADAIARGASRAGWSSRRIPLSDGGEGLLEVLGAVAGLDAGWSSVEVHGPLGRPVAAPWMRMGTVAVVETAKASGLALVGGASGNDAMAASSWGTGELIMAAVRNLLDRHRDAPTRGDFRAALGLDHGTDGVPTGGTVLVGLGGSATTDGGAGMAAAIEEHGGLDGIALIGACDVDALFVDAAERFARQKGASDAEVVVLEERLRTVAGRFAERSGVDVTSVPGSGAAGGMGGAIVALGGHLRSGYRVVAGLTGLPDALRHSGLAVTGEGAFDATSFAGTPFAGKVTGSVLSDAAALGVPSLVVTGRVADGAAERASPFGAHVVSLGEEFGEPRAMAETAACIEEAVAGYLASYPVS
jgi:glycerate 2-kinase